jgi:hypothetical protein
LGAVSSAHHSGLGPRRPNQGFLRMAAEELLITKSDFRTFREAPRHLWASKHDRLDVSAIDQLAVAQGRQVEELAKRYLESRVAQDDGSLNLFWQETQKDGPFLARADALVGSEGGGARDLYEIKSSTTAKAEDIEDAAFQTLIFRTKYEVRRVYLVLVDNTYVRSGALDLEQLLRVEDVTNQVDTILQDVENWRVEAVEAAQAKDPAGLEHCWKPKECPCLEVCHPELPDFSIYNIPHLGEIKKRQLEAMGIRAAKDIPSRFSLSDAQRKIASLAKDSHPVIDTTAMRQWLSSIQYPVYFLDYETCNLAVPLYDGYKPYEQIVFQYSLHRREAPEAALQHCEHLATSRGDPAPDLVASLRDCMGSEGSVIVWHAPFEKTRNKELGQHVPDQAEFLAGVNARVLDLMEIVSKGMFLHPDFRGSNSIKEVLPVLVPQLSYEGMQINEGRTASERWWEMLFGDVSADGRGETARALLEYCKTDTLAMVELLRYFTVAAEGEAEG